MELNHQLPQATPKDSASVIMLRDSPQGPEVFLVRRHGDSAAFGGAYVFPGGKLDHSDAELSAALHLDDDASSLLAALAEPELSPEAATGLFVAAIREAFEECGVLFGIDVTPSQSAAAARMLQEGHSFNGVVSALQIRLHTRLVRPWSRWVTPVMPSLSNKRFDTRFFVATVPAQQIALHDNIETTESLWLRPRRGLELYWDGQLAMAPPQIMTLAHLARYPDVASVFASARSTAPALILPHTFNREDGMRVICYPGDPLHSVASRAMPGPTRLLTRNKRFEPEAGFEAWFS
jgi:8-oxo-dGTP pyrophosphatase MutT (NUDIX family)